MKEPKRGRPSLGADARTELIQIRVSPTERADIEAAASPQKVSEWARERLLAAAKRKR